MRTILTKSPEEAAEFIKRGGIVAFPTETVYGLGANVFDESAVAKIFAAKQRPADNPLIAHIADIGRIAELSDDVNEYAWKFIDAFFPGPLTVVLKKSRAVPRIATAGLDTIGVRMPRFALAQQFLSECATPVVAPSANLSGRPSPTTWEAVLEDLDGRIDCILQSDATEIGLESTVVDCTSRVPLVLRLGAISLVELQLVVPETWVYEQSGEEAPRSPGVRHKHYSPRAKVLIAECGVRSAEVGDGPRSLQLPVLAERIAGSKSETPDSGLPTPDSNPRAAYIGLSPPSRAFEMERICGSVEDYAHSVFEFFRECDRRGIATIYCETVKETGIGTALMDRLKRASEP